MTKKYVVYRSLCLLSMLCRSHSLLNSWHFWWSTLPTFH